MHGTSSLDALTTQFIICTAANAWTHKKLTEMTDMTARAPKVPPKTSTLFSLSARSRAKKNVLSPSSENKIRRNPDTIPSLNGESPMSPAKHTLPHEIGMLASHHQTGQSQVLARIWQTLSLLCSCNTDQDSKIGSDQQAVALRVNARYPVGDTHTEGAQWQYQFVVGFIWDQKALRQERVSLCHVLVCCILIHTSKFQKVLSGQQAISSGVNARLPPHRSKITASTCLCIQPKAASSFHWIYFRAEKSTHLE